MPQKKECGLGVPNRRAEFNLHQIQHPAHTCCYIRTCVRYPLNSFLYKTSAKYRFSADNCAWQIPLNYQTACKIYRLFTEFRRVPLQTTRYADSGWCPQLPTPFIFFKKIMLMCLNSCRQNPRILVLDTVFSKRIRRFYQVDKNRAI